MAQFLCDHLIELILKQSLFLSFCIFHIDVRTLPKGKIIFLRFFIGLSLELNLFEHFFGILSESEFIHAILANDLRRVLEDVKFLVIGVTEV
jgi:hypothetical protein